MSVESDDDEFNVLQPNTPNIPRKIATSTAKSTNQIQNRTEAGPSRNANKAASNKRRKGMITTRNRDSDNDDMEVVEVTPAQGASRRRVAAQIAQIAQEDVSEGEGTARSGEDSGVDEIEEIVPPPTTKSRGDSRKSGPRSGKPFSSAVSGPTKASTSVLVKGKGKQRAVAAPKKPPRHDAQPMETDVLDIPQDDIDVDDVEDVADEHAATVPPSNRQLTSKSWKSGKTQHPPPQNQRKDEYIARLEKQLQQAEDNIKDLTRQLEELCQVRKTEPEQLMERMETQHQALIEAKDSLLADLNAQLAKRDPVLKSGKKSAFELLTRDEANNEMHVLQEQVKKYREVVLERDQRLKDQQKEIETLQEDKRIMSLELKEEVRRNEQLNARAPPPSSSRPRAAGTLGPSQDPKYATIINFYEDLTNVIVPNMKMQTGKYLDLEEWILNCCYTHKDVVNKNNTVPKSINFNLRLGYEPRADAPKPITKKEQLVPSVFYTPLELQNESKEFVESLEFLGDKFTFERDQLSLFVRTLYDYVGGEKNEESDGESSDNSVQIVE